MINFTKQEFQNFYSSTKTVKEFAVELTEKYGTKVSPATVNAVCADLNFDMRKRPRGKKVSYNIIDLDAQPVEQVVEFN